MSPPSSSAPPTPGTKAEIAAVAQPALLLGAAFVTVAAAVYGRRYSLWAWMLGVAAAMVLVAVVDRRWLRLAIGRSAIFLGVAILSAVGADELRDVVLWGGLFAGIGGAALLLAGPHPQRPPRRWRARGLDGVIVLGAAFAVLAGVSTLTHQSVVDRQGTTLRCGSVVQPVRQQEAVARRRCRADVRSLQEGGQSSFAVSGLLLVLVVRRIRRRGADRRLAADDVPITVPG